MTALYDGHDSGSSPVRISILMSRASSSISTTSNQSVFSEAIDELTKLRLLWWEEGNFHPQARWEQVKLPYTLVEEVSLEEYERRADKFNIHGCWDWMANKIMIYEFPLKPHETLISEITRRIIIQCDPVSGTDAHIGSMGAVRTWADNTGHEADATFRPPKPRVRLPTGSNGEDEPWPNLVVEVAYTQSQQNVLDKVQDYWLMNHSRVHDVIVAKIDQVPEGETPRHMQAWHFCVMDRTTRNAPVDARTHFEFGTHDQAGLPLNILPGTCVININLSCLYHDVFSRIAIPQNALPDPIPLDFLTIRDCFLRMFETR